MSEHPKDITEQQTIIGNSTTAHPQPNTNSNSAVVNETLIATNVSQNPTSLFAERYQIVGTLGEGAMGKVMEVFDTKLQKNLALKVIKKEGLDHELVKRFFREANLLNKLNHPHIVNVHACGQYQGQPYFTMDIIQGKTLKDIISEKKTPFKKRIKLLIPIIEAIHNAHANNVIHRDLKPANIMITHDGKPVVMDFGIAHKDDEEATKLTRTGMVLGTPMYMSPEQINGEKVTPQTDIYALGVILYELITEQPPFSGNLSTLMWKIGHEEPVNPCQIDGKIPKNLANICLKALKKNPNERYRNAREMANDLKRYLQGKKVAAKVSKSPQEQIILWGKQNKSIVISAFILIIALFVGLGRSDKDNSEIENQVVNEEKVSETIKNKEIIDSKDNETEKIVMGSIYGEEKNIVNNNINNDNKVDDKEENKQNNLDNDRFTSAFDHVNVCSQCYTNATTQKIILSENFSDWKLYEQSYVDSILLHIQEWDGARRNYALTKIVADKINQHIRECSDCQSLSVKNRIGNILENTKWEIYDPKFVHDVISHQTKSEQEAQLEKKRLEQEKRIEEEKRRIEQIAQIEREREKERLEKEREKEYRNNSKEEFNPKRVTKEQEKIMLDHIGRPPFLNCEKCFEKATRYEILPKKDERKHGKRSERDKKPKWENSPGAAQEIWKHATE